MTAETLDQIAARAVYVAKMFERALHDEGPWTMTWGPHEVPAVRTEHEDGIAFTAEFPETCWIERPEPNIVLRCRGEVQAVRVIEHPGDAAFAVTWDLEHLASLEFLDRA